MTTSNQSLPGSLAELPDASAYLPEGFPDPAELAKLANAFFRDLPQEQAGGWQNAAKSGLAAAINVLAAPAALPAAKDPAAFSPSVTGASAVPVPLGAPQYTSGVSPVVFPAQGAGSPLPAGVQATSAAPAILASAPTLAPATTDSVSAGGPAAPVATGGGGEISEDWLRALPDLLSAGSAVPPFHAAPLPELPGGAGVSAFVPGAGALPVARPLFAEAVPVNAPQLAGGIAPSAPHPSAPGFLSYINPLEISRPELAPANATGKPSGLVSAPFDIAAVQRDFPILQEKVNGRRLVWLDNAATTHKPQAVIDRLAYFYAHENSNIHRAAHTLAARATDAYEEAREKVRAFLGAGSTNEIIFVRGATEGINLVAQSWGRQNVKEGDEIVVSWLEHHANIVPWQQLAAETGAKLRVIPVNDRGELLLDEYEKLLGPRTRIVSVTQVSNALGTVTPVQEIVAAAHRHGAKVLIDGAQAVSHIPVDVRAYDADFYVFSGHKVFGPTGIGVVYGKQEVLEQTQPWQGGGNMIADVTFERTLYHNAPARFEAGTGNIADAIGLGAAIDYVQKIGMANINRYEHALLEYGTEALSRIPGVTLIGTAKEKASVLSFVLEGFKTEEVGKALSEEGIAVRSGHHCAQPILRRFGLESTVRPSLAFYNTCEDIDALVAAVWSLKRGNGHRTLS